MGDTSGNTFVRPELMLSSYNSDAATSDKGASIDVSQAHLGYVSASATADSRLKLVIEKDGYEKYAYDMPQDGKPIICPINMGDGTYTISAMQEGAEKDKYVPLHTVDITVSLESEFEPFIRPSFFCMYDANSQAVQMANELTAHAENQGDVVKEIYNWVTANIDYDMAKAESVKTGYVPDPDLTLESGMGICFDYSSLVAAMLRSQGIPCKIVTGYVSSDNIYHAWNMIYIEGSWVTTEIDVQAKTWTRIDTTFAAGGDTRFVGDGSAYTDRYTY